MPYSIGSHFPSFSLQACVSTEKGQEFSLINQEILRGTWSVIFFYPLDFTFVCPTEIIDFSKHMENFREKNAKVYGVSGDSHYSHLAWRTTHPDLKNLEYPLLADYSRELSGQLGILHLEEKVPLRATYIVDPDLSIRWICLNDLKVGRSVQEVLRVLDAIQTNELCPCDWNRGQATLKAV